MQSLTTRSRQALTLLSAILLTCTITSSAVAQDDDDRRSFARVFTLNQARIGVMVQMEADKENDKLGATIKDVVEDGPAEKAGLKEGDIITRFNGTSLGGLKADDDDVSGPGSRLVKLAQKLDKGDTVQVEYRRGGENRKATIVADEISGSYSFSVPGGMMSPRGFGTVPGGRLFMQPGGRNFSFRLGEFGGMGGLELTDLSPELGEYFGARSGVLVLKVHDSAIGLKPGDVITAIDGRTPSSESHVHRILSSYESGETAKIEVLRKQKKVTVSYKVPENELRWKRGVEQRGVERERVKTRTRA